MGKRKKQSYDPWAQYEPLAVYNAECARGLVHTPEQDARMAALQERFDKQAADDAADEADTVVRRRRGQISL